MDEAESKTSGISGAVHRLSRTLFSTLQTRVELFGLELQEEKYRLVKVLIWTAAVIFFAVLTIISLTVAIVMFCPPSGRPYVLGGFAVLYGILTWRGILVLQRELREGPAPWSGTVGELKKDAEWIRSQL